MRPDPSTNSPVYSSGGVEVNNLVPEWIDLDETLVSVLFQRTILCILELTLHSRTSYRTGKLGPAYSKPKQLEGQPSARPEHPDLSLRLTLRAN